MAVARYARNATKENQGQPAYSSISRSFCSKPMISSSMRFRLEARREIDRLIRFLDKTDDYVSRELEDEGDREEVDDDEPSLGSFDRVVNQEKSYRATSNCPYPLVDAEVDDCDREDSIQMKPSSNRWKWEVRHDRPFAGQRLRSVVPGIARIDTLGPCRRLVFTIPSLQSPGSQNVVVKLIMTAELLATLSCLAAGADQQTISPELLALEPGRTN